MQTFLPYPDFKLSAACLDYRRLGKQRVEAYQILKVLNGESSAWSKHPATKMWMGYADALKMYGYAICSEWIARGYKDSLLKHFVLDNISNVILPPWIGDDAFHASHRSNLLRKDFQFYSQFNWQDRNDLPYIWP